MTESQPKNKNPTVNWNELYEKGTTPWDMGDVTPAISDLLTRPNLPHRPLDLASIHRVLIPGCGNVISFCIPHATFTHFFIGT
jgi:Thiopurine S-methyltransferase (TPMT)